MAPTAYSKTQIVLHWTIVALVFFQILFNNEIVLLWEGRMDGSLPNAPSPNPHVLVGLLILALTVWRLVLRLLHGVPKAPASEHPVLRFAAAATHILFYVLLFAMPISGAAAWFLGVEAAAGAHSVARFILIPLILVHVAAALVHHFWFKTNVLRRMLGMT
jgi:cytochrome b561